MPSRRSYPEEILAHMTKFIQDSRVYLNPNLSKISIYVIPQQQQDYLM